MLCPTCKSSSNRVIDSRLTEGSAVIRRRRVCQDCERRFTTKERVEAELRLSIIKANGQRVPYCRDNIFSGVDRACYKLEINEGQIQRLVDQVEEDLFTNHDKDVSTEQIGRYVGNHLRRLNSVAYVRFMSVHRKYGTVDEFIDEITAVRQQESYENPTQQTLFEKS